jgi:hypothetical protein
LAVARQLEKDGLSFVPQVVRACATSGITLDRVHAALTTAQEKLELELRHNDNWTPEENALCLPGPEGTHLGTIRFLDAAERAKRLANPRVPMSQRVSPPPPTPNEQTPADSSPSEVDVDKLRQRIERAIKRGIYTAAGLSRAAGLGENGQNDMSRLRKGKGLLPDKLVKIDAALNQRGY